ncbi:MAG TPA: glycosyltransferase family 2 protein [Fimbriimonadaceae bacterium]
MPEVTAIIVNYRTPELTKGATRSCLTEPEIEEVIVIDNGSGDDSADQLTEEFRGQRVRVMENDDNVGFATANNKGISRARTDYVFLLNSDAFVLEGAIGTMLARLKKDPQIGIIGPEVLESDGSTVQSGNFGPFPSLRTIFTRDQHVEDPNNPDWISGVCMMMNRTFAQDLQGFDDRYFMYFEDVDLCRRAREKGMKVVRDPAAKIVHFGGKSLKSDFKRKKMYYTSQDRYLELAGVAPFGRNLVKATRWPVYAVKSIFGR